MVLVGVYRCLGLSPVMRRRWLLRSQNLAACLLLITILFSYYLLSRKRVQVVVVEEHHEVMLCDGNACPQIHIDAHSDESSPLYTSGFPKFHFPSTEEHVQAMLQRNDVFIQLAVMSGLIDRVIWIWPSWDKQIHQKDHVKNHMSLGTVTVPKNEHSLDMVTRFCECSSEHQSEEPPTCYYVNMTALDLGGDPQTEVKSSQCTSRVTYLSEHVRDQHAYRLLNREGAGSWILSNASIILDIDEDFFGVGGGYEPLRKVGVSWPVVRALDDFTARLLCPDSARQEALADTVLQDLLTHLRGACADNTDGACAAAAHAVQAQLRARLLRHMTAHAQVFCSHAQDAALNTTVTSLLRLLGALRPEQLQVLAEVGFCLSTSPVTLNFEEVARFQVCHGNNVPRRGIVPLHVPGARQLADHVTRFHALLSAGALPRPRLVTVARSVRDGYTPQKHFSAVESAVLRALFDAQPRTYDVTYDPNLLGGDVGVSERNQAS